MKSRHTSHGYVVLRVGKDHHLASAKGDAYEHRVVAERMLGRRLRPGEVVHHRDGNKSNNSETNLEVVASQSIHLVRHRGPNSKHARMPGEANPLVACECGCGKTFAKYDAHGRRRRRLSSHGEQRGLSGKCLVLLATKRAAALAVPCAHCGKIGTQKTKTLCRACYEYRRTSNGKYRDAELIAGIGRRGERCHSAKLSEAEALDALRSVAGGESQASVAARLGVGNTTVNAIVKGRNWRHLSAWAKSRGRES